MDEYESQPNFQTGLKANTDGHTSSHEVTWPDADAIGRGVDAWELLPPDASGANFAGKRVKVTLTVIE